MNTTTTTNKPSAKPDAPKAAVSAKITMPETEAGKSEESALTTLSLPLGVLWLEFANGKTLTLDSQALSPDIIGAAIMHGLKQKLVDAAAISRDPETGRAATIETKFVAVRDVYTRLLAGEWNKRREGGPTGGLLRRALVELYAGRKTPEYIEAYLGRKSDKEKAALRKNPKIAEIIDRLRKADAKDSGEDVGDDLLAELEADETLDDEQEPVETEE